MARWGAGLLLTSLLAWLLLPGCQPSSRPVTLGFVGALSGRASGIGQEGRDAFLLAVEQFNAEGGLHGRPIHVLVRDHQGRPAEARRILQELKEDGAVAVVGPMMSQMAVAMAPEADRLQLPVIGPTVSTEELSGTRDYFFRPHYSDSQAANHLARLMADEKIGRVTIVRDLDNQAYVESWSEAFQRKFPGRVTLLPFRSSQKPTFADLVQRLKASAPEAVLILANAPDTGMLAQHMARQGVPARKYATCWSASGPLIQYGGDSVEGLEFLHSVNIDSHAVAYITFRQQFRKRFGREPLFPAVHAYDATRIVLEALSRRDRGESLDQALLRIRTFDGVQYPLVFTPAGDLDSPPLFLTRIDHAKICFVCNVATD